jgi:hypothetical protein
MANQVAIHPNKDIGTMKDPCLWISNHLRHIPFSYCQTLQKLHLTSRTNIRINSLMAPSCYMTMPLLPTDIRTK